MSERDQTAEGQVAGSQSQNTPREKLKLDKPTGFCEKCDREITKRDPLWIVGQWLACSQACADTLVDRDKEAEQMREHSQILAHPMQRMHDEALDFSFDMLEDELDIDTRRWMIDEIRAARGPYGAFFEQVKPIIEKAAPGSVARGRMFDDEYDLAQVSPTEFVGRHRARMPDLFADIAPHQSSSPTSRAAAEKNASTMRSKMYLVYQHIKAAGREGATRQQVADMCGISLQTVCGRVRRLYQMGLIGSNPGHTRRNQWSGFENEVMVHEDYVVRWQPDQQRPAERPSWERDR